MYYIYNNDILTKGKNMKKMLILISALIIALPMMASAKEVGQVVAYFMSGWTARPGNASPGATLPNASVLERSTHVVLFQVYPNADGSALVLDWWNINDNALRDFVNLAHSKGTKVILGLGGGGGATWNFHTAANNTNRARFVQTLKNFVELHNLDGIDLDWEGGPGAVNWRLFTDLAVDLKAAMPDKWIMATIGADGPRSVHGNHFSSNAAEQEHFRRNIWSIDALQLMTYDMGCVVGQNLDGVTWTSSFDAEASIRVMNNWAAFGAGQEGFCKSKILIGVQHLQDTEASTRRKVSYARQNGFGGTILWLVQGQTNNHLNWIWDETVKHGGHVVYCNTCDKPRPCDCEEKICDDCGKDPCECCEECGKYPCECCEECCEECGKDPCECVCEKCNKSIDECSCGNDPSSLSKINRRTVRTAGAGISNGVIHLSLGSAVNNAQVTLYDVRGRILYQREISLNGGVANVAIPASITRNQKAILRVTPNSGANLTKRVLIR